MLSWRVVLPAIAAAAVVSSVAVAQGSVTQSATGNHTSQLPLSCSGSSSGTNASVDLGACISAANPSNVNGGYGDVRGTGTQATASATSAMTSVTSGAELTGSHPNVTGSAHIAGTSSWSDMLTWTNSNVASVGVTYDVKGAAYAERNMSPLYFAGSADAASSSFGISYGSTSQVGSQTWTGLNTQDLRVATGMPYAVEPTLSTYITTNDVVNTTIFHEYDVTGSSIPLFWSSFAKADANMGNIIDGEDNDVFAYARVTSGIGELRFFDANHVDITDQVQYEFTGNGVSSTPEPTSLALLGTGLVGLFPVIRRRKR